MLDSERTFKIKVRSRWIVFEILLTSAVNCISRTLHGKKIVQYLQSHKRHKVDQGSSKKLSYRVLQESPCLISRMIFDGKYFSGYILLTEQISFSGCL